MRPLRRDIACLALLCALVAAVFPTAAYSPSNLLATRFSDAITQFLPHQLFARRSVFAHHRAPFWNPYECAGTPAFPNALYPALSLPAVLLLPLPATLAINLGFLLQILLAGALAFALARRSGCSRAAALLAGLVYALGARSLAHAQAGLCSRMAFFSLLPLPFICAEGCLRNPSRWSALSLAASLALVLLTGEAQLAAYALAGILGYSAVRVCAAFEGRPAIASRRRSWACLLAGILFFIPLSSFYLLPSLRLYPLLSRAHPLGRGLLDFMPSAREIAAAVLCPDLVGEFSPPGTLPWECALFMGVVPLLLVARGLLDGGSRRALAPWMLLCAGAFLLSIREFAGVHAALARLAPPLGQFRNPGRMLYLATLFSAVLAARAFDSAARPRARASSPRAWLIVLACGMLAYAGLIARVHGARGADLARNFADRYTALFGPDEAAALDAGHLALGASLCRGRALDSLLFSLLLVPAVCGLCALAECGRIRRAVFALAVGTALFAELLRASGAFLEAHPLGELYPPSPLVSAVAAERGGGRLLDASPPPQAAFWTAFPFALSTALGLPRVDGYTPVNFTAYARYLDAMSGVEGPLPRWSLGASAIRSPGMLSLLGAGLVISAAPLDVPGLEAIGEFADVPVYRQFLGKGCEPRLLLYRNRNRLPRAWLVPRAEAPPPGRIAEALVHLDPFASALVERGAPTCAGGEPYRTAAVAREAPGVLEIEVTTERDSYLCTREIWAPGWEADDGGRPRAVERVNGIFCGMPLPPGRHLIRLRYTPPGLREGAAVSLLALGAACAAAWRGRGRCARSRGRSRA